MNTIQEPKYKIHNGRLVNRQSDEVIPDDEPLMIFRVRDNYVARVVAFYLSMVTDETHREAVHRRLQQFHAWAKTHPERTKEPDTQLTHEWP